MNDRRTFFAKARRGSGTPTDVDLDGKSASFRTSIADHTGEKGSATGNDRQAPTWVDRRADR